MKKYIFLAFALFGMLSIGSCNDDEPIVPPSPGEEIEIPESVTPVLVQTLYFDFGSNGTATNPSRGDQTQSPDVIGIISLIMMGFTLKLIQSIPLL